MSASASAQSNSSDKEMASSPDIGSRGFIAVNHASTNESDSSSRLSSPQAKPRRGSGGSSLTQASVFTPQQTEDTGHHKRKRSQSAEDASYDYNPSSRPEPQHMANRALRVLGSAEPVLAAGYQNAGDSAMHAWQPEWSTRQQSNNHIANQSSPPTEAAEREESAEATLMRPWDLQPKANGQLTQHQDGHDSPPGVTHIGPKRKRNFSNRTKTGCMTCRQRKKKCDETHPICNNCTRGGFQCQGYNMTRRIWPVRPPHVKAHIPLQAKDEGSDVSDSPGFQGRDMESPLSNRPTSQYEGGQARPMPLHDHDNSRAQPVATTLPQSEGAGRPSYAGHQPWPPQQQQNSYNVDQLPSLSDLNQPESSPIVLRRDLSRHSTRCTTPPPHPQPSYQIHSQSQPRLVTQSAGPPAAAPNMSHPPPPQQPSGSWQGPQRPSHGPAPTEQHQTSPAHGRGPSISMDLRPGSKHFGKEDVARSQMMRGSEYKHFDPTLRYERQRCERALNRYTAACQLDSGISDIEAKKLLAKVFDPSQDTTHKLPSNFEMKGHLGAGVEIEVPFTCTYGYNLRIQEDVYIGKGCVFDDAGPIEVGPRSVIAPGVKIVTTDYSRDSIKRKGPNSEWLSRGVTIQSEVIVGAGSLIYPGVTLGRGCTVEAGSVVRESVPEYAIYRPGPGERFDLSREVHQSR